MRLSEQELAEILSRQGRTAPVQINKIPSIKDLPPPKKPRRYRNEPVEVGSERYDSKHEYACHLKLLTLEKAGEITELRRQVVFELAPAVILHGRKKPALRIIVDFTFIRDGELVAADAKSAITRKKDMYRAKAHLLKHVHGLEVEEL